MTAQIPESLHFQGEDLALCTNPLDSYFSLGGAKPAFADTSTALWRGYIGRWDIVDGRLYLVGLSGTLEDGTPASLETVFPGYGQRVFAHWYTGTLRLPQGRRPKYVHMGYGSVHERDLLIDVARSSPCCRNTCSSACRCSRSSCASRWTTRCTPCRPCPSGTSRRRGSFHGARGISGAATRWCARGWWWRGC